MKAHPKATVSCNRSALDFLPEAVRKAELMRPQVATCGKHQKSNFDPSVSVIPRLALVGSYRRLDQASRPDTAAYGRHFLLSLRGMKQLKPRAAGSPTEAKGAILLVCASALAVCKKPASRACGLLGGLTRVVARLLPDRPDFSMQHHRFQGAICE